MSMVTIDKMFYFLVPVVCFDSRLMPYWLETRPFGCVLKTPPFQFERTAVRSTSHCTDSFKKTSKGKNGDKATSTRTPRHKGSVEAPQGSISNASGAGRNSRRGQAAGLESLENPPRPLHLDVDARQTLNGRRRGHESAAAAANTAGLSPHGVSSPTFEAPLPPPGL